MDTETTYAVVDLETTGTSLTEGGRIIQIGCVFVKNNKIINHFSTDINPEMSIPDPIVRLTGITNKRVAKAPIFDDVAEVVYGLLTGTTFVAHNVNFDFPFINREFERVGFPPLDIPAVDTVQLSQILLPTATSYRLQDLSHLFNISHHNPHSADSDAEATANLFIFLLERMAEIPLTTLKQINKIQPILTRQTGNLFEKAIAYVNHHLSALPDYLYVKNGLALRTFKPDNDLNDLTPKLTYPKTQKQKKRLYQNSLEWRPEQARMMNLIYQNYAVEPIPKNLLVEAPTGIGKSLGYALPMAYLAQQKHQVVISTATTVLQDQLLHQTIPALNQVLPFRSSALVLKGSQHYIDLDKFAASLSVVDSSPQSQLVKMKMLVWLTMTTTGDLDELHLATDQVPFLDQITHLGFTFEKTTTHFYEDDFLRRRNNQLTKANFIITNHAYLAEHGTELGKQLQNPYLVIDEAQHLTENVLNKERQSLTFSTLQKDMRRLQTAISNSHGRDLLGLFEEDSLAFYSLEKLYGQLTRTESELQMFGAAIYHEFIGTKHQLKSNDFIEIEMKSELLANFFANQNNQLLRYKKFNKLLRNLTDTILNQYNLNKNRWLMSDKLLISKFERTVIDLLEQFEQLFSFQEQVMDRHQYRAFWVRVNHIGDVSSLNLISNLLTTHHYLSSEIYAHFQPVLLTGASLMSSRNSPFIYDELDVKRDETKSRRIKSTFDFSEQSQLYIATDSPDPSSTTSEHYESYLIYAITKLLASSDKQTLVLFNSLETIKKVYGGLRAKEKLSKRTIMAQGITGSREKIIKRFKSSSDNAIILGASSFWEGLDFPSSQLELLIVTRLPFESPDRPMTKAMYNLLKDQGKSPFYSYALPKATLKLKQGIGRLIRTRADTGVTVILDSRINQRKYGQAMLGAVPEDLPVFNMKVAQICEEMALFYKQHDVEKDNPRSEE